MQLEDDHVAETFGELQKTCGNCAHIDLDSGDVPCIDCFRGQWNTGDKWTPRPGAILPVPPGVDPAHCRVPDSNPKSRFGIKKPPLHLVPPASSIYQAQAMKDGAQKYGPYNWRENSVAASVYVAAALRHLTSWYDGEDKAQDSGVHHLGHALACIGIIVDAIETGNLVDDRPKPGAAGRLIADLTER